MKKLAHPGFTWIVIFAIRCCLQGKRFVETGLCLLYHPIWRKCKVRVFFKPRLTELKEIVFGEIRISKKLCSAPEKIWRARDLETPLAHTCTKMYKSTHVHMNTCAYVCTHRYKCMHKCTYTHTYMPMNANTSTYTWVYYVHTSTHAYTCMGKYTCTCMHTYHHVSSWRAHKANPQCPSENCDSSPISSVFRKNPTHIAEQVINRVVSWDRKVRGTDQFLLRNWGCSAPAQIELVWVSFSFIC